MTFIDGTLNLYRSQMAEMREEAEDLLIKEKNMKQDLREALKKVDMKEIKQLRNDHKLKSMIKFAKKSEGKLDKVKIRLKNLEGDALILAFSVVFIGPLSVNERMETRKKLAEKLMVERNIESSEYWLNTNSEQIHCKYFKKVIQNDFGLKSDLFTNLGYLFVDSLFSEFLFTYLMAPSLPVIYDAVGVYQ